MSDVVQVTLRGAELPPTLKGRIAGVLGGNVTPQSLDNGVEIRIANGLLVSDGHQIDREMAIRRLLRRALGDQGNLVVVVFCWQTNGRECHRLVRTAA